MKLYFACLFSGYVIVTLVALPFCVGLAWGVHWGLAVFIGTVVMWIVGLVQAARRFLPQDGE